VVVAFIFELERVRRNRIIGGPGESRHVDIFVRGRIDCDASSDIGHTCPTKQRREDHLICRHTLRRVELGRERSNLGDASESANAESTGLVVVEAKLSVAGERIGAERKVVCGAGPTGRGASYVNRIA
jgi:hypothetical protein